eukprot:scaffold2352_cov153-Ochromonas_danica.AAC.11
MTPSKADRRPAPPPPVLDESNAKEEHGRGAVAQPQKRSAGAAIAVDLLAHLAQTGEKEPIDLFTNFFCGKQGRKTLIEVQRERASDESAGEVVDAIVRA